MPKLAPVATCAATLLLLTACGGTSSESASDPTAPNVEAATNTSTPEHSNDSNKSSRGNIIRSVGEPAGVYLEDDEENPALTFNVKSIEVDPTCTSEFAVAPENGHFVAFDIEVETGTPDQFEEAFYSADYEASFNNWEFIAPNGTRANSTSSAAMYSCLNDTERLPDLIGPGERATGKVVIDVPETHGTFIYSEPMSRQSWEWEVPTN